MENKQKILENLWVRVIIIGFSIAAFFTLCYFLRGTLISFFMAFFIAYIFNPVVNFFENRHCPFSQRHIHRGFGISFIIIAVLLATGGFLTYAIPKTTAGFQQVIGKVKEQYPKYQIIIDSWIAKYGKTEFLKPINILLKEQIEPILNRDKEKQGHPDTFPEKSTVTDKRSSELDIPTRSADSEKTTQLQKINLIELLGRFKTYVPHAIGFSISIIKNIFYNTFGFIGILANFIIFGIVSIYLLLDFNIVARKIKDFFPSPNRENSLRILSKVNDNLRYFLRGQLIICLILSFIYSIGLIISDIPLSFLIGFIAGFGNLIPYVGTGTGILLASTLALLQYHDIKHIIYICITFGIGQILEGLLITPKIMGKGLGLSPVMVILSILICSQLLGFLGLLLAVPIASTVKVLIDELLLRYKSSQYYKG
ncbi:MAG: hypothetical protein A2W74_03765 [Planctomycetes bacterium RIFCSPLOWO2_12_38_17]|nr:MAG: hypothetical protein A2W74_03765 [Planctomycetes bacterium RIFCSPLOWO2_12_38_17]